MPYTEYRIRYEYAKFNSVPSHIIMYIYLQVKKREKQRKLAKKMIFLFDELFNDILIGFAYI